MILIPPSAQEKSFRGLKSLKKIMILSLFFVSAFFEGRSQMVEKALQPQSFCGTISNTQARQFDAEINQMKSVNSVQPSGLFQPCSRITINVRFHIIRNTNGTGGQPTTILPNIMTILNNRFNSYQIFFNNLGHSFINNNYYSTGWNGATEDANARFNDLITQNVNNSAINIYILPIDQWNQGRATLPGNRFVIGGRIQNINLATSNVVAHEMGHCLGLEHTFRGPCTSQSNCYELPNGSNSTTCGDLVADTPADPGIRFGLTANSEDFNVCTWKGTASYNIGFGPCIAPGLTVANYTPLTNNIMSYAPIFNCFANLTLGQGNRARMELLSSTSVLLPVRTVSPMTINISSATINGNLVTGPTAIATNTSSQLTITNQEPFIPKTYTFQNTVLSGNMNTALSPFSNNCNLFVTGTNGSNSLAVNVTSACGNAQRSIVTFIPSSFMVTPNPSSNVLTVTFSNTLIKEALPSNISIIRENDLKVYYESKPQQLFEKNVFKASNKLEIDIAKWPRGIYYLSGYNDEMKKNKTQENLRLLLE